MEKVVTFGEIMLRLSAPGYNRFVQSETFDVTYGGSEANVAISLANYDVPVDFVTKLPDNEIGQSAFNTLRKYGVGTNFIKRGGERLGIYFLEKGASQRPSKVVYDRKYSSISRSNVEEYNWKDIFKDATWFHISGITPALSEEMSEISIEACKYAKELGLTVSCDLNYRSKLWSQEESNKVMSEIIQYVDVCIANEEDIEKVFGIKAKDTDVNKGKISYSSYEEVARQFIEKYQCKYVACTLRTSISASDNNWTSVLFDGEKIYQSKEYSIHIVDRVGGGDSFSAGLIYGFINKMNLKESLNFATAASCLKHTIEGDYNLCSVEEVLSLANGNESGRVQR